MTIFHTSFYVKSAPTPNFGDIQLNNELLELQKFLNLQLLELCNSLPKPLTDSAVLLLQNHFTGGSLHGLLNFYTKYYSPAWTVLYWLHKKQNLSDDAPLKNALRGQAMAMFLHMFDDHISDGQIPVHHLQLQLRTHAWNIYIDSTTAPAANTPDGDKLVQELIAAYYTGVHNPVEVHNIEEYKNRFRHQMATWLIHPMLSAQQIGPEAASDIRRSYESFGIAWRILDDLRDITVDVSDGELSSVYYGLDSFGRGLWRSCAGAAPESAQVTELLGYVHRYEVTSMLQNLIVGELENAAQIVENLGLAELAQEYRLLLSTLV